MNSYFYLGSKYQKLLLSVADVAAELGMSEGTIHNKIGNCTFPVPSRLEGRRRIVDIRDLAEYLDRQRAMSLEQFQFS